MYFCQKYIYVYFLCNNILQTSGKTLIEIADNESPWHLWLQCASPDSATGSLPPFDKQGDILIFLKMYDPYNQTVAYCGHVTVPIEGTTVSHIFNFFRSNFLYLWYGWYKLCVIIVNIGVIPLHQKKKN